MSDLCAGLGILAFAALGGWAVGDGRGFRRGLAQGRTLGRYDGMEVCARVEHEATMEATRARDRATARDELSVALGARRSAHRIGNLPPL